MSLLCASVFQSSEHSGYDGRSDMQNDKDDIVMAETRDGRVYYGTMPKAQKTEIPGKTPGKLPGKYAVWIGKASNKVLLWIGHASVFFLVHILRFPFWFRILRLSYLFDLIQKRREKNWIPGLK